MQRALHRTWTLVVGLVLTAGPTVAHACPVCMAGERRTLMAYFGTAVLLSVLPFVLFGGMALWFVRQNRTRPAGDAAVAADPAQLGPAAASRPEGQRGLVAAAEEARATT